MTLRPLPCPAMILAGIVSLALRAAEPAPALAIPSASNILSTIRAGHPRLIANDADFTALRARVGEDPTARDWFARLKTEGDKLLSAPPSTYEIPDGVRLLSTSRRVLLRVQTLALLRHLTGDTNYTRRAGLELEAAAAFPDWNPRHFLDTAEMTHAFAIGYDWLFHDWTPATRERLRTAMVEKGFRPALEVYRKNSSWTRARHNWNQVCNGGMGLGALALAEVEPELAGEILSGALTSLQLPMREFAPDGAWAEGPGYWNYATTYNCAILAAVESTLGTDFGLGAMQGFADAGLFPIYLTGPLGRTFNYADGGDGTIRAPHLFWMAHRFGRPAYAAYQREVASPHPLDLVWWRPEFTSAVRDDLPLNKHFRAAEVVTFRNRWGDRNALFVGFKAGDNKANHSNLDLGSFVLDALGVRWVVDLGADDYNLPGYFGAKRWSYYRMRAESHNTLVLNPSTEPDQDPSAATRITAFEPNPRRAFAEADLTPAYVRHARGVTRRLTVADGNRVVIRDRVQAHSPAQLWWFLHTRAGVKLSDDSREAMLTQDGQRLHARVAEPPEATFALMAAQPLPSSPRPEKQHANEGVRKLAIQLANVRDVRLTVILTPLAAGQNPPALDSLDLRD
ncbi:MAG: heparinase II/III family protein [Verrucomicrobia bacterium]|nr:heparinase II/III family protein [Verrucomicrobiota bacterium]